MHVLFHLYIVIFEGKLFICFDFLYFVFVFSAYVQEILDTYRKSSKNSLKDAALKLKEMSRKPMDSMFEKPTRAEALKKRSERCAMVILDVPPTTPGTCIYLIHFLAYVHHIEAYQYTVLFYAASWCSILFQFKMIFFIFIVGCCWTIAIK